MTNQTWRKQTWPAPAKINLFLHIVGQRADGYHLLQTAFQFLTLADELTFSPADTLQVEGDLSGVTMEQNLVYRAASTLKQHSTIAQGCHIAIKKYIPDGAGLGGGSSDAATTLLALNKYWQCHLSLQQLCEIGVKLGADIPVFIKGHAAWAEGIGEILTPISPPEPYYLVAVPDVKIATPEIFTDKSLTRDSPLRKMHTTFFEDCRNDCEPVARRRYPQVDNLLNWLNQFALARMTGTGSAIFAPFESKADALHAFDAKPDQCQAFVTKGKNLSQTVDFLK